MCNNVVHDPWCPYRGLVSSSNIRDGWDLTPFMIICNSEYIRNKRYTILTVINHTSTGSQWVPYVYTYVWPFIDVSHRTWNYVYVLKNCSWFFTYKVKLRPSACVGIFFSHPGVGTCYWIIVTPGSLPNIVTTVAWSKNWTGLILLVPNACSVTVSCGGPFFFNT